MCNPVAPVKPVAPVDPSPPTLPLGITISNKACVEVPILLKLALVPGAPMVTELITMVAASPVSPLIPCMPVAPVAPCNPVAPVLPIGPVMPCAPDKSLTY